MLLTLRMRRFAAHMDRDRPDADGDAGPQLVVASMNLCARWRVGARWRCRAESRVPVRGCVTVRSQNTSPAIGNAQDPKTPAYKPISPRVQSRKGQTANAPAVIRPRYSDFILLYSSVSCTLAMTRNTRATSLVSTEIYSVYLTRPICICPCAAGSTSPPCACS